MYYNAHGNTRIIANVTRIPFRVRCDARYASWLGIGTTNSSSYPGATAIDTTGSGPATEPCDHPVVHMDLVICNYISAALSDSVV